MNREERGEKDDSLKNPKLDFEVTILSSNHYSHHQIFEKNLGQQFEGKLFEFIRCFVEKKGKLVLIHACQSDERNGVRLFEQLTASLVNRLFAGTINGSLLSIIFIAASIHNHLFFSCPTACLLKFSHFCKNRSHICFFFLCWSSNPGKVLQIRSLVFLLRAFITLYRRISEFNGRK